MAAGSLETIFAALDGARVRYIVVGGVAVVLHGHPRFTADLDLVLSLDPDNVRAALAALRALGYVPRVPVAAEELADPERRRDWLRTKSPSQNPLGRPSPAFDPISALRNLAVALAMAAISRLDLGPNSGPGLGRGFWDRL